jgi:anti-anti-sigma factor
MGEITGDKDTAAPPVEPPWSSFSAAVDSMDGSAVVVVRGELDMDTAPELGRVLEPLITHGPKEIVLDFSEVSFLDSSGIATLIANQNRLREQGRSLSIHDPLPQVLRVLTVTALTEFLGVDVS